MSGVDLSNARLMIDDSVGQYVPQYFARWFTPPWPIPAKDKAILEAGPTDLDTLYWEVWDEVLTHALWTSPAGVTYTLHHDGALWAIPRPATYEPEPENGS